MPSQAERRVEIRIEKRSKIQREVQTDELVAEANREIRAEGRKVGKLRHRRNSVESRAAWLEYNGMVASQTKGSRNRL